MPGHFQGIAYDGILKGRRLLRIRFDPDMLDSAEAVAHFASSALGGARLFDVCDSMA